MLSWLSVGTYTLLNPFMSQRDIPSLGSFPSLSAPYKLLFAGTSVGSFFSACWMVCWCGMGPQRVAYEFHWFFKLQSRSIYIYGNNSCESLKEEKRMEKKMEKTQKKKHVSDNVALEACSCSAGEGDIWLKN